MAAGEIGPYLAAFTSIVVAVVGYWTVKRQAHEEAQSATTVAGGYSQLVADLREHVDDLELRLSRCERARDQLITRLERCEQMITRFGGSS